MKFMKITLILWFSLVLFTMIYEITTYECHKYGFDPATNDGICRSEALANGFMAAVFPPAYWAFEFSHK